MDNIEELFPGHERVIFNHAALELTLVQLKFPPVQRFHEENYLVGIKEVLTDEYPLVNPEKGMNIVIGPEGVNQSLGVTVFRFNSIDMRWSVVLSHETISLETREYSSIEEFSERFHDILSSVATHFHPRHQLRLGLRFVNEFRHPEGDRYETWRRLLNNHLLGLGKETPFGGTVEQTIGEILTRREDGHLLVRHGFLNGTTVIPIGKRLAKTGPFYLLDLDYYDDTPTKFNVEGPIEQMQRYNNFLYKVFLWSIGTGELYNQLRG